VRPRTILRMEYLLPVACVASAVVLGASEFMNTFALRPPGGETVEGGLLGAGDRHQYALLILAIFAVIAVVVVLLTGSKPAAVAVGIAGAVALLIFLINDLPHVNQEGTPASFFSSTPGPLYGSLKAYPVSGFWMEMLGALALAVAGGALATLRPDQLEAMAPGASERRRQSRPAAASGPEPEPARSRATAAAHRRERELAARRAARRRRASG
jgi:hypothetical protein